VSEISASYNDCHYGAVHIATATFGQWLGSSQISVEKILYFYVSPNPKFCSIVTIVVHLFL
jgi:hypothetical protein